MTEKLGEGNPFVPPDWLSEILVYFVGLFYLLFTISVGTGLYELTYESFELMTILNLGVIYLLISGTIGDNN